MAIEAGELVRIGREWVGTPFHAGQAVKGAGCDCAGFVFGVLEEAGVGDWRYLLASRPRSVPAGYVRLQLIEAGWSEEILEGEPSAGDILLTVGDGSEHLCLYAGGGRILHCVIRYRGVVAGELRGFASEVGDVVCRYRWWT